MDHISGICLKSSIRLAALLAAFPVASSDWTNPGSGDWFEPANWASGLPNLNLYTAIDNGGQAIIAAGDAEAQNLRVGDWNDGNLLVSGGTLYVSENIEIARVIGTSGLMDIQGGTVTLGGNRSRFIVSNSAGGGQLNLSGGSLFSGTIDVSGGIFNHSAGTIERWPNGATMDLEVDLGGSYQMSGNAQATLASLVNAGGNVVVGGDAFLEVFAGLNLSQGGALTLQENATISYGSVRVGGSLGDATFTQTGGNLQVEALRVQGVRGSHTATITGGEVDVGEVSIGGSARFEDQADLLDVSNVSIDSLINIQSSGTSELAHSATFNASQSTLAGSIQVYSSGGTAVARQTGGTAVWNTMRVFSDKTLGSDYSSTYVIDGADVTVVNKFFGADPTYYDGTVDFENSAGTLRFEDAAYADLTAITFANQSNASLVLGDNMLVRVNPGQVVGAGFGAYQPGGAVIHETGSDLVVGPSQTLRVATALTVREKAVVRGVVTDNLKNTLQLVGGVVVDGGELRMQDRGFVGIGQNAASSGVYNGGLLQARHVHAHQDSGSTAFVLDSGEVDVAHTFRISQGTLRINDGSFYARFLETDESAGSLGRVEQNGGDVRAEQLRTTEYTLNGGTLVTDKTTLIAGGTNAMVHNAGLHRTSALNFGALYDSTYQLNGGKLEVADGVIGIGSEGTFALNHSAAEVELTSSVFSLHKDGRVTGAGNATLTLDEHSLLVLPSGVSNPFGTVHNAGMTWDAASPLTIPGWRDVVIDGARHGSDHRITVLGTVRGAIGDNFSIYGTVDMLSRPGGVNVGSGNPVIHAGQLLAESILIAKTTPYSFTHHGGDVTVNNLYVQREGNRYLLNGGGLRINESADFRTATALSNDGTHATLTAASGSHVDFFFGLNPGAVSGVQLVVEPNALVTFAAGYDYNAEFNSVTNNGLIHEDGTTLVIPEGTEIVAGSTASNAAIGIDGDVVLNGTLGMRGYNRSTGSSLIIDGGLTFGEAAAIDIGIAWNQSFDRLEWQRLDFDAEPENRPTLDGELRVSFDNQVYLDGDEELFVLNGLFSGGSFNDGAERIFTTGGEGSFLVEYRDNSEVYLTDYLPYRPLEGDLNGDGNLTNADISAFVMALTDPDEFAKAYHWVDQQVVGDFNGDGALTNGDIAGFVAMLTGEASATSIPEPATLMLLGLAGCLTARRRRAG